jgi:hypothetical protein
MGDAGAAAHDAAADDHFAVDLHVCSLNKKRKSRGPQAGRDFR